MVRDLLIRGMVAGAVAGLLAFGVAKVFGEPQIDSAIAFEEQHAQGEAYQHSHAQATADAGETASAHGDEEGLVSRKVQSTAGLLTAVLVYGAAMGGLYALAFAFLHGRVENLSPRLLALLLAAAAFAALYYVPSLKYPASPPAVGDGATIGYRTGLFFLMLLISLGALTFAVAAGRRLIERLGALNGISRGSWPLHRHHRHCAIHPSGHQRSAARLPGATLVEVPHVVLDHAGADVGHARPPVRGARRARVDCALAECRENFGPGLRPAEGLFA